MIRILVSGPFNSGKTTFIATLCSDYLFISTDRKIFNPVERKYKERTTIAFDFGVTYALGEKVYLYGTPGQKRFSYFIDTLMKYCEYLVYLVDSSSVASVYRAKRHFQEFFHGKLDSFKDVIICANKRDISNVPLETVEKLMNRKVYPLIATDKKSCIEVLKILLKREATKSLLA